MIRVLFVCVENSCRSQMAEGFARKLGLDAHSAGSRPSGKVNETAAALMMEKGVSLDKQHSKGVGELPSTYWDWVITMGCGDACPRVAAKHVTDWPVPDPKTLPLDEFRKVRDEIERRVAELAKEAA